MPRLNHPVARIAVALVAPLLSFGCDRPDNEPARRSAPAPAVAPAAKKTFLPAPEPILTREGMIIAALRAATAASLGIDDSKNQSELKGRRFEVRIRFGCAGEESTGGKWSYDEKEGVLRTRAQADLAADKLKQSDLIDGAQEGAVGFTLRRPWMLVDGCPNPAFAPMADGPAIAIAQIFTDSDSRVQRPPDSYEAVAKLDPDQLPRDGLNLVVAGRLEALADGRPIHCAGADGPPACIISTKIDRVAIEDPLRKVELAEWTAS